MISQIYQYYFLIIIEIAIKLLKQPIRGYLSIYYYSCLNYREVNVLRKYVWIIQEKNGEGEARG